MKVMRKLQYTGSAESLSNFREKLRAVELPNWSYEEDVEGRASDARYTVMAYHGAVPDPAKLWLIWRAGSVSVANVVPIAGKRLSKDDANAIVTAFSDEIGGPLATELGLTYELGDQTLVLEDRVSDEVLEKLTLFRDLANPETGLAHADDERRWMDVIIQSHRDGSELGETLVTEWLLTHGWRRTTASNLANAATFGLRLLKHLDGVN